MLGSARQLRLRPAAVAFALGETVKLQHHIDIIGQQQRLDLAAQTAQAERHDGRPQLGCAGDVALHRSWKVTLSSNRSSPIVPRTEVVHRMPVACGAGMARTRTDEGAILR
jgi:hypothetical protein